MARMLRYAGGILAQGNRRSVWDGCGPGFDNPEQR